MDEWRKLLDAIVSESDRLYLAAPSAIGDAMLEIAKRAFLIGVIQGQNVIADREEVGSK
jgi:hypothetical protein